MDPEAVVDAPILDGDLDLDAIIGSDPAVPSSTQGVLQETTPFLYLCQGQH